MTKIKVNGVKTASQFIKDIESIVSDKKIEYMDAVILYCEVNDVEIEAIAGLIKGSAKIKARIQQEAEDLNYLPKSAKLPI